MVVLAEIIIISEWQAQEAHRRFPARKTTGRPFDATEGLYGALNASKGHPGSHWQGPGSTRPTRATRNAPTGPLHRPARVTRHPAECPFAFPRIASGGFYPGGTARGPFCNKGRFWGILGPSHGFEAPQVTWESTWRIGRAA